MEFEEGEVMILNEGKTGWKSTLALTNKRLLWLKKDEIEDQIRIENISEVYPNTKMFTNLTEMKIKMKDGQESSLVFKSGDMGLALGGMGYASQNARTMTDRYVAAINKLLNAQTSSTEKTFCRYCGEKNENDAVFCRKCGKKIA